MVAISRTQDNRRELGCYPVELTSDHWQDVLVGSSLGICVGEFRRVLMSS